MRNWRYPLVTLRVTKDPDLYRLMAHEHPGPHEASVKVLAQGMLDVGLSDSNKMGTLGDVIDCGAYTEPLEIGQTSVRKDALIGYTIVTASGSELISRGVPVAADEIEALKVFRVT